MAHTLDLNRELKTAILKKHQVSVYEALPIELLRSAEVESYLNELAGYMGFSLNVYLAETSKVEEKTTQRVMTTVSVPLTWWDHLKTAHAPKWFLDRWPAKTRIIDVMVEHKTMVTTTRLCPHTQMEHETKHVAWLAE